MIIKHEFPYYSNVKDKKPHLKGRSYGITYKVWSWYDTLRGKRVIPCVLLKDDSIIQDRYIKRRRGRSRTCKRKVHYLDDTQDVFDKCRDMYFQKYFDPDNHVGSIQESIRSCYNSEPIKLLERYRHKERWQERRRHERERAASFYGKSPMQVRSSDVNALRKDSVI